MNRVAIYFTDGTCESFPFTGDALTFGYYGTDNEWFKIGDGDSSILVPTLDIKTLHFVRGTDDVAS